MHRLSIMDSPEAPISHHWLDSTHITLRRGDRRLGPRPAEARGISASTAASPTSTATTSRRRGSTRWPSASARTRRPELALQASWARQVSPEQLRPGVNERRWSASAIYTVPVGAGGWWSTTAIWAQRRADGGGGPAEAALDAWVLESALHPDARWTVYGRAERVDNDELLAAPGAAVPTVGKAELGVIRDFAVAPHLKFGVGGQAARAFVPRDLAAAYGGDRWGAMGFVRLKLD